MATDLSSCPPSPTHPHHTRVRLRPDAGQRVEKEAHVEGPEHEDVADVEAAEVVEQPAQRAAFDPGLGVGGGKRDGQHERREHNVPGDGCRATEELGGGGRGVADAWGDQCHHVGVGGAHLCVRTEGIKDPLSCWMACKALAQQLAAAVDTASSTAADCSCHGRVHVRTARP